MFLPFWGSGREAANEIVFLIWAFLFNRKYCDESVWINTLLSPFPGEVKLTLIKVNVNASDSL